MKKLKLNKIGLVSILFLATTIFLTSCYSDYGLSNSDHDVVITQYRKTSDFSKYKTFAIIDSVFHLTGDTLKPDSEYLSRKYDNTIIKITTDNMIALGHTQVLNPPSPDSVDIVIYIAAKGTKVDQYYTGSWWGGGYYPDWGWGGGYYPGWGYPGYVGKTTYYVGTLFINYVDVSKTVANSTITVEWHAILNGLLNSDSYSVTENRLEKQINQAFNQSAYLTVK